MERQFKYELALCGHGASAFAQDGLMVNSLAEARSEFANFCKGVRDWESEGYLYRTADADYPDANYPYARLSVGPRRGTQLNYL